MRKQLGQMLIEAGAIDEAALRSALADQRRWGRPLGRTLVELRLIREDDLVRILGQQLGLPSVDLDKVTLAAEGGDEFTKICGHSLHRNRHRPGDCRSRAGPASSQPIAPPNGARGIREPRPGTPYDGFRTGLRHNDTP